MQGNFAMLENQAFPTVIKKKKMEILDWWRPPPYFSITACLLFLWTTKWEAQPLSSSAKNSAGQNTFMLKSIYSWAKCKKKESVYNYVVL